MELETEVRRGKEAALLLEHPLLIEAFHKVQGELMYAWHNSPARDVEGRETIFIGMKLLGKLEAAIREHVTTGKMAAVQLHNMSEEGYNVKH